MAKYRDLFLEEATEHLGEMSRALLELEKDTASSESIDLVFRMAHSIKSMAASLGYDSISELSHVLEDRMHETRTAGCLSGPHELTLLFQGMEGLERMVAVVRETGEGPAPDADLCHALAQPAPAEAPQAAPREATPPAAHETDPVPHPETGKKKALS